MSNQKNTKQRSSSVQKKIRNAGFVSVEEENSKGFKYKSFPRINNRFANVVLNLKRNINTIIQKPRLWVSKFDWEKIKDDSLFFFIDVFIEGFAVNFVMASLFGAKFTLTTILAYGLIIVQGANVRNRLKHNGSHKKLLKK